jgi:hypothetical protein
MRPGENRNRPSFSTDSQATQVREHRRLTRAWVLLNQIRKFRSAPDHPLQMLRVPSALNDDL